MLSVNLGVACGDADGSLFSPAFTRFPRLGLIHADPASGLCAGDRRTRAASTLVVPPIGDLIADVS